MMTLVIGGAGSGKSEYAERLLVRCRADAPRYYIATMEPFDDESRARVEKHRAARAGRDFTTIEQYTDLASLTLPRGSAALLECMGNLCANELFSPQGSGENAEQAILRGIERLREQCSALVIVSNEVLSGGTDYLGETERYLRLLGRVNCALAAAADNVCEVVCGVPVYYKGGETE